MTAEIISVGTELLLGNILNTNAQYLSRELAALGITVQRESTIGDNHGRLADFVNEAKSRCDITISIDCDGQDDINAMDEMVKKYLDGAEVVYGVRSRRDTDTFFKRFTAEGFYHLMNAARGCHLRAP